MVIKKSKAPQVGLMISQEALQVVRFNPKTFEVAHCQTFPLPEGTMAENGDRVADIDLLTTAIQSAVQAVKPRPRKVTLSLTGTLLRMVGNAQDGSGRTVHLVIE